MSAQQSVTTQSLPPIELGSSTVLRPDYFAEWEACRAAIDRFDGMLLDVRKFGFSFIAALLSAEQLARVGGWVSSAPSGALIVAVALVTLSVSVFALDIHYQCLLSGAVERALDLESASPYTPRLTKFLCVNALATGSGGIAFYLYVIFVAVASFSAAPQLSSKLIAFGLPTGISVATLCWMLWYRNRSATRCGLNEFKPHRAWHEGPMRVPATCSSDVDWAKWAQQNKQCLPLTLCELDVPPSAEGQ